MNFDKAKIIASDLINYYTPNHTIKWNFDSMYAGTCDHGIDTISFSRQFTEISDESEFINTVLHEIAHALVGPKHNHDIFWKNMAKEIGCDAEQFYNAKDTLAPRKAMKSKILKAKCPYCGNEKIKSQFVNKSDRVITYECNHTIIEKQLEKKSYDFKSYIHGYTPYKFQVDGATFFDESNGRILIADEMGLGKTIQALMIMREHPELAPFMVFCKASLKVQWFNAIIEWLGIEYTPQIIDSGKEKPFPGFKAYILSLDTLRNLSSEDYSHVKTVIIDECQLIKNHSSKRTKAVREFCADKKYTIALSGTPIKNHAGEYFPVLNILQPGIFPKHEWFLKEWVDSYSTGYSDKFGGIKKYKIDEWNELTKNFIIRRTKSEVMPDLPKVSRGFQFHELGKEVEADYKLVMTKFAEMYDEGVTSKNFQDILSYMNTMRHLTGKAKIEPCYEFLVDFLNDTERKITVFVHHKDVGSELLQKINLYCRANNFGDAISFTSDLDPYERDRRIGTFRESPSRRILIASTQAGGEGINLQFCHDFIMLERQWNPANEEQAENRFSRIGIDESVKSISGTYFIATGTIDEYFTEIVERKRLVIDSTMSGTWTNFSEQGLLRELMDELNNKGRKRWKL